MKAAQSISVSRAALHGFTLLELMTALAVMGILLGVGVPAFTSMTRNSQIAAESANLASALNLARSEAIKRGTRVSLCPAAEDMTSCLEDDSDWSGGWLLFEDDFGDAGVMEESDVLLQTWGAPTNGVTITTEAKSVTFTRQARSEVTVTLTFLISKEGCTGDQRRQIDIDISGRISSKRVACS